MKVILPFIFLLVACSHGTYKAEMPDGNDQGIIYQGKSLVFSIPPGQTLEKMKLSFRGIHDGDELHLRLRFLRKQPYNPTQPERMDPKDLTIQLEGHGAKLKPVRVHASQRAKPFIVLNGDPKQAVELVYKIPLAKGQKAQFAYFNFDWRIEYLRGKFEAQSVRFDRQYAKSNLSAIPFEDPDFGQYDEIDDRGWFPMDAGWY